MKITLIKFKLLNKFCCMKFIHMVTLCHLFHSRSNTHTQTEAGNKLSKNQK